VKLPYNGRDKTPFISVVIPTYNSAEYITPTLESVFSQTYDNYEVIISDDGSSDNTNQIVNNIFVRFPDRATKLLANKHFGAGASRNIGIKAASGEWIAFLDSDDLWSDSKLWKVADYINNNENVDLVCHSEIWRN